MNAMMKHVALMLAVSLPLAARAQEDFAPAKAAIDSLKQLPASVARVQQVIQGTSYGPFEISGSCGYDKQWYCLGMACKTFNWWWKFPNYTWFKDSLSSRYGQVSSTSGQFDTSFAPVRNWMKTSLPQFSQQLDRENVILTTAEQVVMNPASAPEAVARAKADIAASLNRILAGLQPGVQQLNEGISSLSNFNSQLNQTLNGVNDLRSSLDQVVASDKASMDKKLGDYPCGDDDARSKYQEVENMVTGQFQNVQSAAQSFGVTSNQTDTAVSLILGTVLTLQTRYQGIAQALNRAQISPAGAVQQLHIDVVSAAWRDFAQYAETQFP